MRIPEDLKYDEKGLLPAVIQDFSSGEVLMVAYMNAESLKRTVETGLTWFWSRSRKKFWQKGETSGHVQRVRAILYDCDQDTLLIKVEQTGPACHTGSRTCFYRTFHPLREREMNPDPDCLFCKIIEKNVAAKIVHEDDYSIAFEDIHPKAPVHLLVVPKKHIADIHSIAVSDREIVGHLFFVARTIASQKGLEKNGYRMVINNGRDAGQTVFHIHLHLLSGRSFSWPPG